MNTSVLYYGDNLPILRHRSASGGFPDASVNLIYLDPPFNSKADYDTFWGQSIITVAVPLLK